MSKITERHKSIIAVMNNFHKKHAEILKKRIELEEKIKNFPDDQLLRDECNKCESEWRKLLEEFNKKEADYWKKLGF